MPVDSDTRSAADAAAASVDPAEVAYYRRLAETWWDPRGPFWPLHGLNRFRSDYIREIAAGWSSTGTAEQPLTGLRVLDIGCGGGLLSEALARMGARVHGIDVVAKNIEVARLHAAESGLAIDYEVRSAEGLAAAGAQYDAVFNMEVVEHVADLDGFMAAVCRLVRPGGHMLLSTINRTALAWATAIIGAEYVLGLLPKGTHHYRKLVRPAELARGLEAGGLRPERRVGVRFNPFRRHFRYTRSLAVNYMMLASRPEAD